MFNNIELKHKFGTSIIIILITLLLIKLIYKLFVTDNFDNVLEHPMEYRQIDTSVEPQISNINVRDGVAFGDIMAAPEFIPSSFESPWYKEYTADAKNHFLLDDGDDGKLGLQYNMCSKSCCSKQYPVPFGQTIEPEVQKVSKDFVSSGYTCNNAWQDSGCVCVTEKQAEFIGSRGGNA